MVTATFLGVSTLLLDDGETRLLIDGFFSRPGRLRLLLNLGIQPDDKRIESGLEKGGITNVDAVLTAHSHFDHAMDVARVARKTGAIGDDFSRSLEKPLRAPPRWLDDVDASLKAILDYAESEGRTMQLLPFGEAVEIYNRRAGPEPN